jgi:predicted house-cleaning noncanonical NTP pyrophosphatase (MazG superfamily)
MAENLISVITNSLKQTGINGLVEFQNGELTITLASDEVKRLFEEKLPEELKRFVSVKNCGSIVLSVRLS